MLPVERGQMRNGTHDPELERLAHATIGARLSSSYLVVFHTFGNFKYPLNTKVTSLAQGPWISSLIRCS